MLCGAMERHSPRAVKGLDIRAYGRGWGAEDC
jgi:hypothetical protein